MLKCGDLVFFAGKGLVSSIIQVATYSLPGRGFSHVGIVGEHKGEPVIYESTSFKRPPDMISGLEITGVQTHPLEDIVYPKGEGKVYISRLKRDLYLHEKERMMYLLDSARGIGYDMIGAGRSGGFFLRSILSLFHEESDFQLFCSELVANVYNEVGIWNTRNFSQWSPNALYRRLYLQGIITPAKEYETL